MITTIYKHYKKDCYPICKTCYNGKIKDKFPIILPMSHKKDDA